MNPLAAHLRRQLERTIISARQLAETGAALPSKRWPSTPATPIRTWTARSAICADGSERTPDSLATL